LNKTELKQYLSEHRNDDDKFSEALQELMSRDQNPTWYPPTDWEETGRIIKRKIEEMEGGQS
jgi:HSP20 family molecular chaperone IbpA